MNPAMILTGSRLITGPLFFFFFMKAASDLNNINGTWLLLAFISALLLELSDAFDGMVARARNEVTDLGKIFDPICDAISRQTMFLAFVLTGLFPIWIFFVFLYRDGLVYLLRIMVAKEGTVMAAKWAGKFKAITQAVATFVILGLMFLKMKGVDLPEFGGKGLSFWVILIPTFFTIQSGFDYFIPNWDVIKRAATPKREN